VKRLAVTIFAVLYVVVTISAAAEHANVRTHNEGTFSHHPFSRNSHRLGKSEQSDLTYETKLLENQFVAELLVRPTPDPLPYQQGMSTDVSQYSVLPSGGPVSFRAPPFFV
jgi:hypothetical protein